MTRLKVADLTSGIGAVVLGVGAGAFFAERLAPAAAVIAIVGVILHGFGMWDKHRLESRADAGSDRWVQALYWVCWLSLAAVVTLVLI